jgi:hypothetical protein
MAEGDKVVAHEAPSLSELVVSQVSVVEVTSHRKSIARITALMPA